MQEIEIAGTISKAVYSKLQKYSVLKKKKHFKFAVIEELFHGDFFRLVPTLCSHEFIFYFDNLDRAGHIKLFASHMCTLPTG